MNRRHFAFSAALTLGALSLALLGCGSGTGSNSLSFVRVDNALLAASGQSTPNVDLYLAAQNTSPFITGIQPNSPTVGVTGYTTTRSGLGLNLYFNVNGSQIVNPTPKEDLTQNAYYTIFVIGAIGQPNGAPAPFEVRLTDIPPTGLPANTAGVRLFHAAPNTLTGKRLTVYEVTSQAQLGSPVPGWQSIGYGQASGSVNTIGSTSNGYINVDTTVTHTYSVRDDANTTFVEPITIPAGTLTPGNGYTLAITGSTDEALNRSIGFKLFQDLPRQ